MILAWSEMAWEDYLYWQATDKKILKRINTLLKDIMRTLLKDIMRNPAVGLGSPEQLKHQWSGYWSRRINREHRLIYKVEDSTIFIAQCRYHY